MERLVKVGNVSSTLSLVSVATHVNLISKLTDRKTGALSVSREIRIRIQDKRGRLKIEEGRGLRKRVRRGENFTNRREEQCICISIIKTHPRIQDTSIRISAGSTGRWIREIFFFFII